MVLTFLFTDIEGSTRLWETREEAMREALAKHDQALKKAVADHNGTVFKTMGDAVLAWFNSAADAAKASIAIQQVVPTFSDKIDLKVRIAVHTGEAEARDNDFFGPTLNRTARILSIAHGGQVLFSSTAQGLAIDQGQWVDCGEHRLKDLGRPEHVFQLAHPTFPLVQRALSSLSQSKHNLPIQTTRFIGRERQIDELTKTMESDRLVTVVGPAGSGKTRLALQTAVELVDQFADGVWFVELATVTDQRSVLSAALSAIGVPDTEDSEQQSTLVRQLAGKKMLLILDNCEHVIESVALIASLILGASPTISILTTSREPLNVTGETVYRVAELTTPRPGQNLVDNLHHYESVQLFVDRARHLNPRFELTDENATAIKQICEQLDGNPLALELAAARISAMSPKEVLDRLGDSLRLLTGGSRTASPRHQTLRGAIEWSYKLLKPKEQVALQRLSVFSSGWDISAATAVVADGGFIHAEDVVDLVTSLVDKSLISVMTEDGATRYLVLGTIRRYAIDLLHDGEATRKRHFDYYFQRAEESSKATNDDIGRMLFRESAEVRSALDWALAQPNLMDTTLEMMNNLHTSCLSRWNPVESFGYWSCAVAPLENLQGSVTRLTSLSHAIYYASHADRTTTARQWATVGMRMAQDMPLDPNVGRLYNAIGSVEIADENPVEAERHYLVALEAVTKANHIAGTISVTFNLAEAARARGDFRKALAYFDGAYQLGVKHNRSADQARCLVGLAEICLWELETEEAMIYARRLLAQFDPEDEPLAVSRIRSYVVSNINHVNADPSTESYLKSSLAFAREISDTTGAIECLSRLVEYAALGRDADGVVNYMRELSPIANRSTRIVWIRACYWAALALGQSELSTQILGSRRAYRAKMSVLRSQYEDWNLAEMEKLVGLADDRTYREEPALWQLVDSLRVMN